MLIQRNQRNYSCCFVSLGYQLDELMVLTTNINWIADEAPQNGNECMNKMIIFLETVLSSSQQILPLEALYKLIFGALNHINDTVVTAFMSEAVKRFTLSAVMGLDVDLKKLDAFANESFYSTGMSGLRKDRSLKDCLKESRQLVNLLLSNQAENFLNPVIRVKNYGSLDYKKFATICDKLKDSADTFFGSLSNRNAKRNARKNSMDMLKKRLKDFN